MEESEVRIVDHKELTQFSSNNFHKSLLKFLDGFDQKECIQILKTMVFITDSFQKGKSFDYCDKIYKKHFLEKYIGRNKNAHSTGLLHYLYFDGIWFLYKIYLLETEKKYTYELTNYDDHIQDSYLSGLIRIIDQIFDLVLTDFPKYLELQELLVNKTTLVNNISIGELPNSFDNTVIQWALYYHYQHEVDNTLLFEKHVNGKIKAIDELANKHKFSAKHFQLQYNLIIKKSNRLIPSMVENIEHAMKMLTNIEKAKQLAEKELKHLKDKHLN